MLSKPTLLLSPAALGQDALRKNTKMKMIIVINSSQLMNYTKLKNMIIHSKMPAQDQDCTMSIWKGGGGGMYRGNEYLYIENSRFRFNDNGSCESFSNSFSSHECQNR